jgi:threonine dehydrogenase-like Zn-dependent dehydrogenase
VRALRIAGARQAVLQEKADLRPRPNEAVIKMHAAGICGSDLHGYRNPRPEHVAAHRVPGHEPAGEILELGSEVRGWKVGDRVTIYFRLVCGACEYCRIGRANVCLDRRGSYGVGLGLADGAHAEQMVVEAQYLLPVPADFSCEDAAIVACQGGTAYYPLTRLDVSGRDVLVVSGLGPVGLLATLFGSRMGARVVGIDPAPERRALGEQMGAARTLDPAAGPVGEQLRAYFPDGAGKLLEASGATPAHAAIPSLLNPLGMAALVGLGNPELRMSLGEVAMREIILFGTSIFPLAQYDEIWAFMRRHGIRPSQVVTHRFGISDGPRAYQLAESATVGKVCFAF